ncbi:DUF4153 domain-containing protein [Sphingomonas psychrotolerans]|uniref:DUF4173 domain-containing protein n=1 Tax=Sphingomonas psychrotolerans TaxID=1327635 RepID=A0A2K8MGJ7_9SPHN|nr:DUF4173 domain-containing protein [Sphingomonas psychrotolerans]ATY30869.1 DUF4173 domain-containing protein [Sphingomonas psychrotolerans]
MQLRISSSFVVKAVAAAALVGLADRLFWVGRGVGTTLGFFALAWIVATLALSPRVWRDRRSWIAAAGALLLAVPLLDAPGLLAWLLFWTSLTMAVLLPRAPGFDHAGRWVLRLILHGIASVVGPWQDMFRLRRPLGRNLPRQRILPLLPLPLLGGAVFLALFASANPVIGDALYRIGMPRVDDATLGRVLFWIVIATTVWATLRPRRIGLPAIAPRTGAPLTLPGVSTGSVLLALWTFNALFALQNGLDIAFLWSGAPLPEGVTLADYAHRGAYPLIATALLAGLFVLVALRPGSATAAVPAIRQLVVLWIAQNIFLVASSILRTIDYIEVYSLTGLRIAALIWMVLVALGLVLIVWRMLRGRSAGWLINANVAAALLVLTGCTMVDLGSVAAAWNIRHAREVGGKGAELDLCYLGSLGPSALTSLVTLELRPDLRPDFAERLAWVRHDVLIQTIDGQLGGDSTWRNGRRLREIRNMLAGRKLQAAPLRGPAGRDCDGALRPPPAPPEPAPQPENAPTASVAEQLVPRPALTNEAAQ